MGYGILVYDTKNSEVINKYTVNNLLGIVPLTSNGTFTKKFNVRRAGKLRVAIVPNADGKACFVTINALTQNSVTYTVNLFHMEHYEWGRPPKSVLLAMAEE